MFLFPCMKLMAGGQPTEQLDGLQKRSWTFDASRSAAKAQVALRTRFNQQLLWQLLWSGRAFCRVAHLTQLFHTAPQATSICTKLRHLLPVRADRAQSRCAPSNNHPFCFCWCISNYWVFYVIFLVCYGNNGCETFHTWINYIINSWFSKVLGKRLHSTWLQKWCGLCV